MKTTQCTARSRKIAKNLLAGFRNKQIQIWQTSKGFQVMNFESPSYSYGSADFETKAEAFSSIIARAACTGFDMDRFKAIGARYFRRFLAA